MSAPPTPDELQAEWNRANDEIQAAYWAFTRQARAKPPFLVCPDAYRRRELFARLIREAKRP